MDLEEFSRRYVVRFGDLKPTVGAPPDAGLERFARERFMLLGRNAERRPGEPAPDPIASVNLAYVRCEPGKGFCSHKHPGWEIFIPLTGRWRIDFEEGDDVAIEAWDVMAVSGDVFHGACNISSESALMMSVNPGSGTAGYTLSRDVLAELGSVARARHAEASGA